MEIRDNLIARITEAEDEGWFGEVEGLQVSLAGVREKLVKVDNAGASQLVELGMPDIKRITDSNKKVNLEGSP